MHSRQTLGAVALGAIVVAAISFAVVDASIAAANGCMDAAAASCEEHAVPVVAMTFAALGVLALLCSIIPAVTWIVSSIHLHHSGPHSDLELARRHRPQRAHVDEFDA